MVKILNGKLELNDNNDYIVSGENLSKILENNYMNKRPASYLMVVNGKEKINEEGILYKNKYKKYIYDYHINGINIEQILFENTDKIIEMEIRS